MINPETGEIKIGIITAELVRGVMTYTCSCGGQKLRPFKVGGESEEDEPVMGIACLSCGAFSTDKWKELHVIPEIILTINGSVDENIKFDSDGKTIMMKKKKNKLLKYH